MRMAASTTGMMVSVKPVVLWLPRRGQHLWRRSPFWAKVTEVAAVVVAAAMIGGILSDGDSFAAWLEAVSTLAAVLAAMYAGFYAANAWKLEVQREDQWVAQQRSEQASRIAAWPGEPRRHFTGQQDELTGESMSDGFEGLSVWLRNASDVPVTRVSIDATLVVRAAGTDPVRREVGTQEVALLEPSTEPIEKFVAAPRPVNVNTYRPGNVDIEYWFEVSVSFRDAGGRDWQRTPDGQLFVESDANASE
jgi:hypothetical protein